MYLAGGRLTGLRASRGAGSASAVLRSTMSCIKLPRVSGGRDGSRAGAALQGEMSPGEEAVASGGTNAPPKFGCEKQKPLSVVPRAAVGLF